MTEYLQGSTSFSYRVHHNWRWVFREAVEQLEHDHHLNGSFLCPERLPSKALRIPNRYALFKLEWTRPDDNSLQGLWISSPLFEDIDAKGNKFSTVSL